MEKSPYRSLRDSDVPNQLSFSRVVTLAIIVGSLMILGLLAGVPQMLGLRGSQVSLGHGDQRETELVGNALNGPVCAEQCRLVLTESIPLYMKYEANATFGTPLYEAWKNLLALATDRVDVASFYWTLTGDDLMVNSSTDLPGRDILEQFGDLPQRNVAVRVASSIPTLVPNSTDLQILTRKGVHVRRVNFGRLTNGILHTKLWIVDMKHIFFGSANMDWRALTQVKELGVVIYNCSQLAKDFYKIFRSYWVLGHRNASIPDPWPTEFDTAINKDHPLLVNISGVPSRVFVSSSPPSFCPSGRTGDLDAILSVIEGAEHFIDVAVMEYFPTTRFSHPQRYWPIIENALKQSAFEQHVSIRLLISCGRDTDLAMLPFLMSLNALHQPRQHINIEVKVFIVPVGKPIGYPLRQSESQ
ncbi:hypothetical protein GJAV_G00012330 [Gymnothorax javanicus]|nr:hypothetical protein GJAV_G00012330 [Gymnothorax javanicus]